VLRLRVTAPTAVQGGGTSGQESSIPVQWPSVSTARTAASAKPAREGGRQAPLLEWAPQQPALQNVRSLQCAVLACQEKAACVMFLFGICLLSLPCHL
jgi:hypothetical protein